MHGTIEVATEGSLCPFCSGRMILADSEEIYGQSYGYLYRCSNYPMCDTYVSCHKGTTIALGTPANRSLRRARKKAHGLFDKLWKGGPYRRDSAYRRLREILQVPIERAHIAMLNEEECRQLCRAIKKGLFKRRRKLTYS